MTASIGLSITKIIIVSTDDFICLISILSDEFRQQEIIVSIRIIKEFRGMIRD